MSFKNYILVLFTVSITFIINKIFSLRDTEFLRLLDNEQETTPTEGFDPKGALPALRTDYTALGKVMNISDLPVYVIGSNKTENPAAEAIIMVYDIFGFDGGRIREMCDDLAAKGYFVILPDFYRGEKSGEDFTTFLPFIDALSWNQVNADLTNHVYPYLEQQGFTKWAMIGACWGGWVVFEASANTDKVVGGISYHPSLTRVQVTMTIEEYGDSVKSPQLVVATKQEPDEVKNGGILEQKIKNRFSKTVFKTFDEMDHGFVPRGDLNNTDIKAAVEESLNMTYSFLEEILPASPITISGNNSGFIKAFKNLSIFIILVVLFIN